MSPNFEGFSAESPGPYLYISHIQSMDGLYYLLEIFFLLSRMQMFDTIIVILILAVN
jgi:hypothetical protein